LWFCAVLELGMIDLGSLTRFRGRSANSHCPLLVAVISKPRHNPRVGRGGD